MTRTMIIGVAFAAGCGLAFGAMPAKAQMPTGPMIETQVVTNGPQAGAGDFGGWSAHRNNLESAQYDRLLEANSGFRQTRMRKECGPITDPQLRAQCLASFGGYEPAMTGSAMPPQYQPRGAGY